MLPLQAGVRRLSKPTENRQSCSLAMRSSGRQSSTAQLIVLAIDQVTCCNDPDLEASGLLLAHCSSKFTEMDLGLTVLQLGLSRELQIVKFFLSAACNTLIFAANGPQRLHALSCAFVCSNRISSRRTSGAGKGFAAACHIRCQTKAAHVQHSTAYVQGHRSSCLHCS